MIAIHDANQDADLLYLATEYIEGVTLKQLGEDEGPVPVARACDYIRQAALGLQHLHEHGLVHRDVKPSNLLLDTAAGWSRCSTWGWSLPSRSRGGKACRAT